MHEEISRRNFTKKFQEDVSALRLRLTKHTMNLTVLSSPVGKIDAKNQYLPNADCAIFAQHFHFNPILEPLVYEHR